MPGSAPRGIIGSKGNTLCGICESCTIRGPSSPNSFLPVSYNNGAMTPLEFVIHADPQNPPLFDSARAAGILDSGYKSPF
jgi:hypothetical protein